MSFFDRYGLLHVEPNESSENGILFLAHYLTIRSIRGKITLGDIDDLTETVSYTEEGDRVFNSNPDNDASRFSHDNMTALYCLLFQFGLWKWVDKLPVVKWNNNRRNLPSMQGYWVHPRDILFYYSLKYPYTLGTMLFPLLLPFLLVSLMASKEVTSGKCLWFLRLSSVSNTVTPIGYIAAAYLALATFVLSFKMESWQSIFAIYFKNIDHPINREIALLWEELDD